MHVKGLSLGHTEHVLAGRKSHLITILQRKALHMLLAQLQVLIDLLLLLLLDKLILLGGPGGICALQGLLRQTYRNCLLLPILRVGHGLPDLPRFLLVAPGLRYGRREPVGVNLES